MKEKIFCLIIILFLLSFSTCKIHTATDMPRPLIITKEAQKESAVNKLVTVRGTVTNTKIPTILGIDVASDSPDLRGEIAMATGILKKTVVTEEELKNGPISASRGPGTYYSLIDEKTGIVAQVKPLEEKDKK